jgi:hypothetical protein
MRSEECRSDQMAQQRDKAERYYRRGIASPCTGSSLGSIVVSGDRVPLPFEAPRVARTLGFDWSEASAESGSTSIRLTGSCFAFANLATLIGGSCGRPHPHRVNAYEVTARAVAPIVNNLCECEPVEATILDFWEWPFLWGKELEDDHRGDHEIRMTVSRHEAHAARNILAFSLPAPVDEPIGRRNWNNSLGYRGIWITNFYSYPEQRLYGHCHAIAYVTHDLELEYSSRSDFSPLVDFLRQKLRVAACSCSTFGTREHDAYAQAAHSRFQWKEEAPDEDEIE